MQKLNVVKFYRYTVAVKQTCLYMYKLLQCQSNIYKYYSYSGYNIHAHTHMHAWGHQAMLEYKDIEHDTTLER